MTAREGRIESESLGAREKRFGGRKGRKCLARSMGPRVFVVKVERVVEEEIWRGDFSGGRWRIPGRRKERWRYEGEDELELEGGGKRDAQCEAAAEMVDSSV